MRVLHLCFVLLACFVSYSCSAGCNSDKPDYGSPNTFPILDGFSALNHLRDVPNGKLFQVTVPNNGGNTSQSFYVIHLFGTPFEMGFAQGSLLKNETTDFINRVWAYFEEQIESVINFFPPWLQKLIADFGLDVALDLTADITRKWTGEYFFEELQGLANSTGLDYKRMLRVHMIAGLTQGKCSMFGAWGKALPASSPTRLLQLRALDWDMDGPFRDYAALTVYHPDNGNSFLLVGMVGFIGALTGISEQALSISEIGVSYPDETFGRESRPGYPFIFLLRDILQFDNTLDDAINRMANTHRTCDLILGVGDGKLGEFRGFEYSYSVFKVFDDMNMLPYNETWHPRITNVVYWGMDWMCPSYNYVLSQLIQKYYGQITPEIAITYLTAVEKSGDNHVAYYDLSNLDIYFSFAAPHSSTGNIAAYARQFTKFNAKQLFAQTQ